MPKKKKKDKGAASGGAEEGAANTPEASGPAPATTAPSDGVTSSLLLGPNVPSKTPKISTTLSPLMSKDEPPLGERDPNAKLLGNSGDMAEMEQALNSHTENHSNMGGGGMNVFAINKDGISRAVVKFNEKPKPQPLTISFHFPGTFLTHRYVVAIIKGAIASIEGADVTAVQYCDRNVRLGTRGLENRWLVTLSNMRAKQMLMLKGIKVVNRTIYVKSYDEVIADEYREYQRWWDMQNRIKGFGARKNKLDAPGASGAGATPSSPARSVSADDNKDAGEE